MNFIAFEDHVVTLAPAQLAESQTSLRKYPMFRVIMLNDDYTPMHFVEAILQRIFDMGPADAQRITMEIHHNGRGICGEFTHEIAEAKVFQVDSLAHRNEFPLLCELEPVGEA